MHIEVQRPSWDDYFIGLTYVIAERSLDSNTHHGAIIVDRHHRVLGTGYNSFPHSIKCDDLPNTRPDTGEEKDIFKNKYLWFRAHSEVNAILNCAISPWNVEGCTIYISGKPCVDCLILIWQSGIKKVVYADTTGWTKDEEENDLWQEFVKRTCIDIRAYKPDLSWMKNVYERVESLGFVG